MEVIYDSRGMRRVPQDRGATRRGATLRLPHSARASAVLAATVGSVLILAATPAAGQNGCAGKPGGPDQAAIYQYCPNHGKKDKPDRVSEAGSPESAGSPAQSGSPPSSGNGTGNAGKQQVEIASGKTKLPLSDYPSTGGINFLVILLAALALAIAVAYGARRWRRSRQAAS
jgi:LPXTG-motif cell wall-anchored protein